MPALIFARRATAALALSVFILSPMAAGAAEHAAGHPAEHGSGTAQSATPSQPAHGEVELKVGDLTLSAPWSRATPGGAKVAAGYLTITNHGATPDTLIAGSFPRAARVEVHEMSMKDGVMTMRPLKDGLTIPPGQSVTLAPGGFHLMFMGLNTPLKQGETVTGTLEFAKAGKVDVSYEVRAIAARDSGHAH